jgi:hypothetical protein
MEGEFEFMAADEELSPSNTSLDMIFLLKPK